MQSLKPITFSGLLILFLTACNTSPTATNPTETTTQVPPTETVTPETTKTEVTANNHSAPQKGGQVVETENYHLELVALPETGGIHIDFYLQTGNSHQAVSNALVTANIEFPNGEQKTLDLTYDQVGEHYAVFFPTETPGEYKIAVLSDIAGEKVNSRFTFKL